MRNVSGLSSRRPFTLLGIVLALLVVAAFLLVALNAGQSNSGPQITVVIAAKDLQPRLPIDASGVALKTYSVPAGYPPVYFSALTDVEGLIPLVTITSGEIISSNDVVRPSQAVGPQAAYIPLPSGYVALTIPTSEQQGVAGYIQPGDYITIIATVTTGTKVATMTIFHDLYVIRVGTPSTGSSGSASSLTVVVTQCNAEVLTWFLTYASLKYTLESYLDYLQNGNTQTPDPSCPSVTAAKAVTQQTIQTLYPGLF